MNIKSQFSPQELDEIQRVLNEGHQIPVHHNKENMSSMSQPVTLSANYHIMDSSMNSNQ